MLSSICTLYLTQGFGQLIINSEKIASFISKEDQENLPNKTVESNVSKQKAFIGLYPKARKLQNIKQLFNKRLQNTTNVIPLL